MKIKKGFTLIELLVTTTVILLLTSIAIVSYASASKRSRDNKRISDLETIRSALEIYRSDNGEYPAALDDLKNNHYINEIPTDPKPDSFSYYYSSSSPYTTYTLCARVESTGLAKDNCGSNSCGSQTCNYRILPP
jgi:prepilin-type N-terminal cleavage/methylation domain-containing protein